MTVETAETAASAPAYLYLLYGEDEFSRSEQLGALRGRMARLAGGEYNITSLDGAASSVDEVLALCQQVPFLADRRMVIVEGLLGRLVPRPASRASRPRSRRETRDAKPETRNPRRETRDAKPATELDSLLDGLQSIPPTTSLLLVEGALDDQLVARFSGPRIVVRRYDPPRGERLVRWLLQRAAAHGVELESAAGRAMAAESEDLRRLDNELAKLAAYCQGPIELEAVRLLVAGGEMNIFALLDAVAEGRPGDALATLRNLYQHGQRPEAVVAQIASLLRRLLIVKELSRSGAVSASQAGTYGLNPNTLPRLQRQARLLSAENLERALGRLLEADRASKTGAMDPELAVELAVAELVAVSSQ